MSETLRFQVDSALLEELGERLVGKPSVAFAELIKNSYDADATHVQVELDPTGPGRIVIEDNGHGMTFEEFRDFWMRVGSTHKRDQRLSRKFNRPLTGSKGVGRISARILSNIIRIRTVSEDRPTEELQAWLDWRDTDKVEDLTEAAVHYEIHELEEPADTGTRIELEDLKNRWAATSIEEVAREVWQLQPPFEGPSLPGDDDPQQFQVDFESPEPELVEGFQEQMEAILTLDDARALGHLEGEVLEVSMEYDGERLEPQTFRIEGSTVERCDFEIRFYQLRHRQPHGIKVEEARAYVRDFGGIHIYDAGFRLPYYGQVENDWLGLTMDHARRIEAAQLLPEDIRVPGAMHHLPHVHHLIGVVRVNTSQEPDLRVTITRDRLQDSPGFEALRKAVRLALEWYATEKARRKLQETREGLEVERPDEVLESVEAVLEHYEAELPKEARRDLKSSIDRALEASRQREEATSRQMAVMGSLATAGISSLAFQHEMRKQMGAVDRVASRLEKIGRKNPKVRTEVEALRKELVEWVDRTKTVARVFGHLEAAENVKEERRYAAKPLVADSYDQIRRLLPRIEFDTDDIPADLLLPKASYAEWVSVFQNLFFNAANALLDQEARRIKVVGEQAGKERSIRVLDNGVGVDLKEADQLFEPFERRIQISEERRNLGFGGTGLGLTIVRTVTGRRGCSVSFVEPDEGYATAFQLQWEEK